MAATTVTIKSSPTIKRSRTEGDNLRSLTGITIVRSVDQQLVGNTQYHTHASGDARLTQTLLKERASPHVVDEDGQTPWAWTEVQGL